MTVARRAVAVCAALLLQAALVWAAGAQEAAIEKDLSAGPVREVEVRNALLTVELIDAPLSDVIDRIAKAGGFDVEYASRDAARATVRTRFRDVPIELGLKRLFALANLDNYFIHYGAQGEITKLEILGEGVKQPQRIEGGSGRPSSRRSAPEVRSVRPSVPFNPLVNPPLQEEPEVQAPSPPAAVPEAPLVAPSGEPTYISPSQRN